MSSHPAPNSVSTLARNKRQPARLSAILDRRLAAYALAAGAAAAGSTALGQAMLENPVVYTPANTPFTAALGQNPLGNTIVYTPANIPFSAGLGAHGTERVDLDLNNDGITDAGIFLFEFGYSLGTADHSYYYAGASWFAAAGNGGINHPLPVGIAIGSSKDFVDGGFMARSNFSNNDGRFRSGCFGPFKNRTSYLGIRFSISGETHYGWIRISLNCGPGEYGVSGTVTGYAYETVASRSIRSGQTRSGEEATQEPAPTPATLGMLGLGSAGLPLWRY
jgi:hypothetical protein